jgi:hypothetical protein
MTGYISGMPVWIVVVFIISFIYGLSFIANPARQAALKAGMTPNKARKIQWGIIGFYGLFLAYVSFFALKGTFDVDTLAPKVMVWAGLPLAVILFGIIGNTSLFKTLLRSITLESLITIHVFRYLGIFFLFLYGYHLLPARFAFFAGLGDVITAIFAVPVARMVAKDHPRWKLAVYAWNIFGIMDIVDLLTVAMLSGRNGGLREMTVFPFSWFPAFAPATILFLHAAVFRKLNAKP